MDPFIRIFPAYFPYGFSCTLVVIIALHKIITVTKGQIYKNNITMKALYWIITLSTNSIHNEKRVIQRIHASNCFYSPFHRTFICFHNYYSFILIPICSIKVKGDSKKRNRGDDV